MDAARWAGAAGGGPRCDLLRAQIALRDSSRARGHRRQPRPGQGRDGGRGGRVWQRQDDARPRHPAPGADLSGPHHLRGRGHRWAVRQAAAGLPAARPGHLPGSLLQPQPVHARGRAGGGAAGHPRTGRPGRARGQRAGCPGAGQALPCCRVRRQVPAHALRRAATTRQHRPRHGARARLPRGRRAGLHDRRLQPRGDPVPARRAAGAARADLPVHHA